MPKLAVLFPGQGSQYVGMGRDLYLQFPQVKKLYDRAHAVLGFDLARICFEGPEAVLMRTAHAQPAILVHSLALWTLLRDQGLDCAYMAGHSLGEFSALTAAGAWDLETGLHLVKVRSTAMQKACDRVLGTMAALTRLPAERLDDLLAAGREVGIVTAANYNAPGQIVVSGERPAVERVVERGREFGARRATLLKVGGAFHSPLMAEARAELARALDDVRIDTPAMPVVLNVTASATRDPEAIRTGLKEQLTAPVLWLQTLQALHGEGVDTFVEVGPGQVLQGLTKRTLAAVATSGIDHAEDLTLVPAWMETRST